jgi:transcriptional regulator with XRE-family HTH domain
MIDYETYVRIRNYFSNDGLKYSQIADELGLDCRTVAKWANEERGICPEDRQKGPANWIHLKTKLYECLKNIPIRHDKSSNGYKREALTVESPF